MIYKDIINHISDEEVIKITSELVQIPSYTGLKNQEKNKDRREGQDDFQAYQLQFVYKWLHQTLFDWVAGFQAAGQSTGINQKTCNQYGDDRSA